MKYRLLAKTGLEVSELSFGCMSLGEQHAENVALLHEALDNGINLFDTADLYQQGENEVSVGKAFSDRRQKVLIATKVGNQWRADGSGWDWNPRKDYILQAVEDSLRRLQTDYIDLYQLHGGTIDDPIDETIEAFELLKKQGKIRFYGISSIRPNVIREHVRRAGIVSNMMQYSLLDRRPEQACLPLLRENRIGVIVRGGLAKGLLAGKSPQAYLEHSATTVAAVARDVAGISSERRPAVQTALKYVLQHPAVTTVALGVRTRGQLASAVGTPEAADLSEAEMEQLRQLSPFSVYRQHR